MKSEAQTLYDTGATPGQVAAELGIHPAIAYALAPFAPPPRQRITRAALEALPEHLQRLTLAWNPLIIEDVTP